MRMNVQTFWWFVFLAVIKNSANNIPFTLQPRELSVKEGCCAAITCTVGTRVNDGDAHWFWIKGRIWDDERKDFNGTIVYSSDNSRRAVSPEFVGRVQIINSSHSQTRPVCSILICDLKKNDSGEYAFRFVGKTDKQKWMTTENVNLKVEENPCLLDFPQPPTLNGSGQIKLKCSTLHSCPSSPEIQDLALSSPLHSIENYSKSTTVSFEANFEDDGKVFSCQIQNNTDNYCIKNISITVEYGPREVVAQGPMMEGVEKGNSVNLICSAKGKPQPTISWFKDESKQSTGPEWRIESIQESQSGQYHCEAENKHGKVGSKPINIIVIYAPQVEISKTSPMSAIREGDEVTLTCDLRRSNPQPTGYYWLKDNHNLNGGTNTYNIVNIKPEHSGSYTCEARNSVGFGKSEPLEITVQYGPRRTRISSSDNNNYSVKVGSNIQLICDTDSNPSPHSYSWYRYNDNKPTDSSWWQSYTDDRNTLDLSSVKRSDEACYMCNATNSIGTGDDSDERCIHVLYPPTVPTLLMPGEATEGQTITISCTVESNPASNFIFTSKKTSKFVAYQHSVLPERNTLHHTFNVTSEHSGSYTCSAENSEGSNQSKEKTLVVKYIPKVVRVESEHGFEVNENKSLILDCKFKSYPSVTSIKWIKMIYGKDEEETLPNSQTFTIKSVSPSDSGWYRCEATNNVGTGKSQQVEVKVKYAPKHTTILRGAERRGENGRSSIKLTCSSHAYPSVEYTWKKKGKKTEETVSNSQNYTVHSNKPGVYCCIAKNALGQKSSEPVNLFEQNTAMIVTVVILCLIALLIIYLLLLVYRRKKSVQRQTTDTQLSFGFLVGWCGIRGGTLRNETVLAEPFRSRDDLLPEQPFRLKAQRCQARPDSTPAANINTVYSTVKLPPGKPTPAAQRPTGWQGRHTEDESLNYASLYFLNEPKTKQAKGEEDVYAKVSKPNPLQKNEQERLQDYENLSVARTSKFPNPWYDDDDSDTSDNEGDVSYARPTFRPKPGCQKDDTESSTSDDDEIKFSNDKFNEGDVNYTQVTFTPKPGHKRDNTDSSTSDDDEIQYSDVKL